MPLFLQSLTFVSVFLFHFQSIFTPAFQLPYKLFYQLYFLNTYYISSGRVPDSIQKYKFGKVLTSYIGSKTCNIGHSQCPHMDQNLYLGNSHFLLPQPLVILKVSWFVVPGPHTWSRPQVYYLSFIFLYYRGLKCRDFSIIFFLYLYFSLVWWQVSRKKLKLRFYKLKRKRFYIFDLTSILDVTNIYTHIQNIHKCTHWQTESHQIIEIKIKENDGKSHWTLSS